jgi:N-hydroxyarylamine O-acetyltransferase
VRLDERLLVNAIRSMPEASGASPRASARFDIPAYLARIGHAAGAHADVGTLRSVHSAHAATIPFENLDIQLGRPILLDADSLQAKLVTARRGGYCFEQNGLLRAALEAIGFDVTPLAAWVRMGSEADGGLRTHMLLSAAVGGEPWIADVGFGADGISEPLPLADGATSDQDGRRYRLVKLPDDLWVLQRDRPLPPGWFDLYAFTLERATDADYAAGNRYTAQDPASPFVRSLTAQLGAGEARPVLRNRHLVEAWPDGERHVARLHADDELLAVLDERFGLRFEPGTEFRALRHHE